MMRSLLPFFLLAIFALVFASAVEVQPKGPEAFDCAGKDGYYADRYRECHVFYRCLPDGTKWTFSCALEMKFSDEKQTCLDADQVYCPPVSPTFF